LANLYDGVKEDAAQAEKLKEERKKEEDKKKAEEDAR
jgi:hypothetical protein